MTADLVRLLTLVMETMDSSWSLAWLTWVGGRCAEHSHQTWGRGWDPGSAQGGTGGGWAKMQLAGRRPEEAVAKMQLAGREPVEAGRRPEGGWAKMQLAGRRPEGGWAIMQLAGRQTCLLQ